MNPEYYEYAPDYSTTPGEILLDVLTDAHMTQAELARRTGLSVKHVNQICQGAAPISAGTAVLLQRALDVDMRIWLHLESESQAVRGLNEETVRLAEQLDWLKNFPVSDLKRRGHITSSSKGVDLLREVLQFFRVAAPSAWEQVWATPTAYRLSQSHEPQMAALASWIRIGERRAEQLSLQPYDKEAFRAVLPQIRALLTSMDPAEWQPELERICAAVGVAVVIEKEIKGARVNGMVRWLSSGNPLLMLSVRHRWADIFWFTFFHEVGHLIIHDRRRLTYVDAPLGRETTQIGGATANRIAEQEADGFASRLLLPREFDNAIGAARTAEDARQIAALAGVHPGIVVGRMQHDRIVHFSQLNELRVRFVFDDD